MEAAALVHPHPAGPTYIRRQPEKTALYQVLQRHLLTFEQQWTDEANGRTLPKFVTDELHGFMSCGILAKGFAHLYCDSCGEHHVVAFSCKARAVCPSCLGRRMSEGNRILRFLQRRGVITLVTSSGDGEIAVVADESMGEADPLLAKLLAAATAGIEPAGPANKRQPIRVVLDADERPMGKGHLCGESQGFNLQAATRVAINDKTGRERLCRYILRPPLANDRLSILDDGNVRLEFKRPWSDGTSSVQMEPQALIARLAALIPPPRRHTVRYFGVLSSHANSRSQVVPHSSPPAVAEANQDKPKRRFRYTRWSELLRRVFGIEVVCTECDGRARSAREVAGWAVRPEVPRDKAPLRLISLIKSEPIAKKILVAMHLPSDAPELCPARGPPEEHRESRDGEDYPS